MWQTGYPLHVMHGYAIAADEALEFARLVHRVDVETLSNIEVVNNARRPLLPYAALVLEHILRIGKPRQVVFSALGVREGLLYSLLKKKDKEKDALIEAARHLNQLRSRSPRHGEELIAWTDRFMATSGLEETNEERRLRHAACLLADIGWRAHPDYRGEQSLNIIAHGGFSGIDHPGRAYLALAVFFRHVGLVMDDELSPRLRELVSTRMLDRARVLGAALRLAYVVSAAMPGVLRRNIACHRAAPAGAAAARQIRRACRRARPEPAAFARAPDRPRAGDADGVTVETAPAADRGFDRGYFRAVRLITADMPPCAVPSCISRSSSKIFTSRKSRKAASSIGRV